MLIFVSGLWRLELAPAGQRHEPTTLVLDTAGDYVGWDNGIDHRGEPRTTQS